MILQLRFKFARGAPLRMAAALRVSPHTGIDGAVPSSPLRHLLLLPVSTLERFSLEPGDLRENVLIDDRAFGGLHQLPSGTVLRLGQVPVRLTFHCEPCGRMKRFVPRLGALVHKRGYLASVVEPGIINEGDAIVSLGQRFEPIPYDVRERVLWYLSKRKTPVPLVQLVSDVGLSASYCRAIPGLLREHPEALNMIARSGRNGSDATLPLPFFTR